MVTVKVTAMAAAAVAAVAAKAMAEGGDEANGIVHDGCNAG